jgi:hypothetical protein
MAETPQSGMPVSRAMGGKTANNMELPMPMIVKQANNSLKVGRGAGKVLSGAGIWRFFG